MKKVIFAIHTKGIKSKQKWNIFAIFLGAKEDRGWAWSKGIPQNSTAGLRNLADHDYL